LAALDRYLHERVTQDIRRQVSNCFVACDGAGTVAAYYTFAATSFPLTELPPEVAKRLPCYGVLPAGLIGRLAVDRRFRGQRLGSAPVIDAAQRAARTAEGHGGRVPPPQPGGTCPPCPP
jgi:GNAT superfamily N-acetyltransferase